MKTFQTLLMYPCLVGAFALTAWCIALVWRRQIALFATQLFEKWSRLGNFGRVLLVTFVSAMIVYGSTKTNLTDGVVGGTTNAPMMTGAVTAPGVDIHQRSCREAVARVVHARYGVVQPEAGRVPAGAVLAQNQWRRGCWEDWLLVSFDEGWVFPYGTNHLSRVVVMTQGELRSKVRDTDAVASLGVKVAHVPFDTCFYHEHTPSNSYRFTWDRAYIDRNTNMPMYAAIELFRNGDKCVSTNGVSTFTPREIPYPHVGIGQNDDWVRTNFVNAADILSVGYANWVDDQVGVDLENGLYKFTATFPDAPPEATQLTVGDLSVVITNAGEYVFLMEKGVEYAFGTTPYDATVEYSMQDDVGPDAEIVYPAFSIFNSPFSILSWWGGWPWSEWTVDGGWHELYSPSYSVCGTCLWLPWLRGSPDVIHLGVNDFPVTFEAILIDYCRTTGVSYLWSSSTAGIQIVSPNSRVTEVNAEALPSWSQLSMSVQATICGHDLISYLPIIVGTNSLPQAGVSVSAPKTIYVNDDGDLSPESRDCDVQGSHIGDDDMVPVHVMFHSDVATNGIVRVRSLIRDGHLWKDINRNAEVASEDVVPITNCQEMTLTYFLECEYRSHGYEADRISVMWRDASGHETEIEHHFTAVECVAEPVTSETISVAGEIHVVNPCCAIIGSNTYMRVRVFPNDLPDGQIKWSVVSGSALFPNGNTGRDVVVVANGCEEEELVLEVDVAGSVGRRPRFELLETNMREVLIYPYLIQGAPEASLAPSDLSQRVDVVNMIYRQVGLHFSVAPITTIDNYEWSMFGLARRSIGRAIRNYEHKADGVEVYFIGGTSPIVDYDRAALGRANDSGVIVRCNSSGRVLAHEIGHVCHLSDVYIDRNENEQYLPLRESWLPQDWNNGTGSRFYEPGKCQIDILPQVLMYGVATESDLDIPMGTIRGFVKDGTGSTGQSLGNAAVGRNQMIIFPPHTK